LIEKDYLIVGQGISGTMLSYALWKKGCSVLVVDQPSVATASKIASGLINPITGRRLVKTWLIDTIWPFVDECYRELEKLLESSFYHPTSVFRLLKGTGEKNAFENKKERVDFMHYLSMPKDVSILKKLANTSGSLPINITAMFIDTLTLLDAYAKFLQKNESLVADQIDYAALLIGKDGIQWKNYTFKKVIFCEGYKMLNNPFFNHLPLTPAKGERLIIRCKDLDFKDIVKHGLFLIPLGKECFWVGTTFEWDILDENPTPEKRKELIDRLEAAISFPFEVVDHKAGIRPTVEDRRPLIGLHPKYKNIGLFNGMGTKGVSLAPYLANQFVAFLEDASPINEAVRLERYL